MSLNEIKNFPIDKRTKTRVYLRLLISTLVTALLVFLSYKYMPKLADKVDLKISGKDLRLIASITIVLMYVRYVFATLNRKWGYAFLMFAYDVMQRPDALMCPRCKTRLLKDVNDTEFDSLTPTSRVTECSCPNTNCGLSLSERMTFSQCPSTHKKLKAFVLNMGIKSYYLETLPQRIMSTLLYLVLFVAIALFITLIAVPYVAKLF